MTRPATSPLRLRPLLVDTALLVAALALLALAWRGDWPAAPADLGVASRRAIERHVGLQSSSPVTAAAAGDAVVAEAAAARDAGERQSQPPAPARERAALP